MIIDCCGIKRKIKTEMKMAKESLIKGQCQEVELCLSKNNSKIKSIPSLSRPDNRDKINTSQGRALQRSMIF